MKASDELGDLQSLTNNLPTGVSDAVFHAVNTFPKLERPPKLYELGWQIILDNTYPITLTDGTTVHGCVIGANNTRIWLVIPPSSQEG